MSLTFVLIPDEMLTNLITNSPNLEDLSLMYCFNVVVLRISNSNLRRLTVGTRGNLSLLEMEAPRLEMFDYHGIFPAHHSAIDEHAVQTSQIVEFSTPNRFGLESLKTLTMANVRVDDATLRKMLSAFKFLETAKLHCCTLGVVPFIVNPRLETLEIEDCMQERILLHSETLQTLAMTNHAVDYVFHSLAGMQFNSLKALELIGNIYFESGIFNLTNVPCLETVVVSSCFLLRDFRLSSHSVNSLTMQSCLSLEEAAINAPNLRSFTYASTVCNLSVLIISDDASINLCLIKHPDYDNVMEAYYEMMLWNFYRMFEYNRNIIIESEGPEVYS